MWLYLVYHLQGTIVAVAGGPSISVWDLIGGSRLIARLANHQKTVTCVTCADVAGPSATAGPRLLSASLDGHVKVYETDRF